MENLRPPRPLTHDLFVSFINTLRITLKEVFIYKYEEGVFYSYLIFNDGKKEIHLDSRTSDAIALAVRVDAPIYILEEIIKEVSVEIEEDTIEELDQNPGKSGSFSFEKMDMDELQTELNNAIAMENYERASFIRDIINKKSKPTQL